MPHKLAVAFVHGIGKQEPQFSDGMQEAVLERFAKLVKLSRAEAREALFFQPVYWAPVLQPKESILWEKLLAGGELDFLSLRRFMVDFAADAVAYQPLPGDKTVYIDVHIRFADALANLAARAGGDAPLVVVAHSLGTVIASNYLYDLQASPARIAQGLSGLVPPPVRARTGDTPLERGETLAWFFTMGSPIALWSLRYEEPLFGVPIRVPDPAFRRAHPAVRCGWINVFDEDDVIGYPLKSIYGDAILQDKQVNSGGLLASWNPLSHDGYWTDEDVIKKVAKELAGFWKEL